MQNVELIKGADLHDLKETLCLSLLDLGWVTGLKNSSSPKEKWKMTGERSELPIPQPYLSILIRYLMKHGDELMLPQMPYFLDVFDKIAPYFDKMGLGKPVLSKFGLLLGVGSGAANDWKNVKEPSVGVQRVLFLLNQTIDKYGEKGFKRYLSIVEEECRLREIGSIQELIANGTWAPQEFANRYADTKVPVPDGLLTGADLNDLRELLFLDWWDFIWLTGRSYFPTGWKTSGKESLRPRVKPSTCILARYLRTHYEDNFMPAMPDHEEIYHLVSKVHPFKKMSARVAGPLFGVTGWSFNQWRLGTNPKPMIHRLFYLLKKNIEKDGQEGFDRYFAIVNEDIMARGLGDYGNVVKNGWGTRELKKKYY